MTSLPRVLVGLVGYCSFMRSYPFGPVFMECLCASQWPEEIEVKELNWGPVTVVQDFQSAKVLPERVVLVSVVDRGLAPGTVSCRRWVGGKLDPQAMQERMFESVTGVVHVDNLLAVGEQFEIWPDEVLVIEIQLASDNIGDYVIEALAATGKMGEDLCEHELSRELQGYVQRLATSVRRAALEGTRGLPDLVPFSISQLTPVAQICQYKSVSEPADYVTH